MEDSLDERLKSHEEAFKGLLALIPAERYYEGDKSEQWQRKKQTKEQAKAARLAKLNPDNARSARDVLEEQEAQAHGAGKRKRGYEGIEDDLNGDLAGVEQEKPMEGIKRKKAKKNPDITPFAPEATTTETAATKQQKAVIKAEKIQSKNDKRKENIKEKFQAKIIKAQPKKKKLSEDKQSASNENEIDSDEDDVAEFDGEELIDQSAGGSPSSKAPSPSFDLPSNTSGTSSISSVTTQSAAAPKPKTEVANPASVAKRAEIQARWQARIAEMRQSRGADGDNARSRTELIEQRRKKEEQRKATKKALRAQAKEEERRIRNEALARGSPLMTPNGAMSPMQVTSPLGDLNNNFSFSRMAFDNGQFMSANLSTVFNPHKKTNSGSVSKDNLEALEKRQERLSKMTPEQRATAEEKDMWVNARKRAQGQRVKDDTSLLKKALKRKDNKKKKSTKEWDDRIAGVANAQAAKQKRREDNIAKRKEEKKNKNKTGGKKGSGKGKKKTKARPGFEGSFKAGGGKKK